MTDPNHKTVSPISAASNAAGQTESVLSLVSKPLDLLNTLEFLHTEGIGASQLKVLLVGCGKNQERAKALCQRLSIKETAFRSEDLYSQYALSINSRVKFGLLSAPLKFLLAIVSLLLQNLTLCSYLLSANTRVSIVITDAWRTKIQLLLLFRWQKLVIIDGGYSTITYGLVDLWMKKSPGDAIAMYIARQSLSVHGSKKFDVRRFFSNFATSIPGFFLRILIKKIKKTDALLFTSYKPDGVNHSLVRGNSYNLSKDILSEKSFGSYQMIIGYPNFGLLEQQYRRAKGNKITPIFYYPHPVDLKPFKNPKKTSKDLESKLSNYPLDVKIAKYSAEWDILLEDDLPRRIIAYRTSFLAWAYKVLPKDLMIDIIDIKAKKDNAK